MLKDSNISMRALVSEYHESGQSQKDFAIAHGVTEGKLHYWSKKLSKDNDRAGTSFVPLEIVDDAPPVVKCILIRCGNGMEIEIPL